MKKILKPKIPKKIALHGNSLSFIFVLVMAKNTENLTRRNNDIKRDFLTLQSTYPKWKYRELLKELEERFYLTPSTIEKILNNNR